MRVLVTGGAGFIGSHVVDGLVQAGHETVVIDNLSTGSIENLAAAFNAGLDLKDLRVCGIETSDAYNVLVRCRPHAVVLCAAQASVQRSMTNPLDDARTNIVGHLNLLEACRRAGVKRVVFTTSGGTIYGLRKSDTGPARETDIRRPLSFYGLSKDAGTEYLRIYAAQFGIRYVALALGNVYGERQVPQGETNVVSIFLDNLLNGRRCVIYGDGSRSRDYVHVSDVARAVLLSLTDGQGLVNVGTGVATSVFDVYQELTRHLHDPDGPIFKDELPGEVDSICLSVAEAKRQLRWEPEVSLSTGIARLVSCT
jgi:UDP-glucose 4-epimerase